MLLLTVASVDCERAVGGLLVLRRGGGLVVGDGEGPGVGEAGGGVRGVGGGALLLPAVNSLQKEKKPLN